MTVNDFLWRFVKWGTPVTIVNSRNKPLGSFIYEGGQHVWEEGWKIKECTVKNGSLKIKTTEY